MVRIVTSSRPSARGPEEPDLLRAVLSSLPVMVLALEPDGRVRFAFGPLLERAPVRGPLAGRSVFELSVDERGFHRDARRALAGEEVSSMQSLWAGRVMEVRWSPLRDRAGRLVGAAAIALEVTAPRRREVQAVRAAEQIPAALWVTDQDLRVTMLSGAAARLLADVVGRRVEELSSELGPDAAEAHRAALRGDTGRYRISRRGRELEAHVSSLLDAEGRPAGCIGLAVDVTEPETLLSLLRATLESTEDGILVVDRASRIVTYNQRFCEIWRLPERLLTAGEDDVALTEALGCLKDKEAFLRRVRELYSDPEAEGFDLIELNDGRVLERYSRPQRLDDHIVGRVWSFRDVTRRHRAEQERDLLFEAERRARARAEEEERRRRALVDGVDAILWERMAGCEEFSYVSDGGPIILGYPAERWLAPGFWRTVVEPADHERAFAMCHLPWPDPRPRRVEYRVRAADGRVRWVQDHVSLVLDERGAVTQLRGVILDLTERKQVEEALATSEARLRSVVENTPNVGVQGYDEHGRVRFWNRASTLLFGHRREEALGRTLADLGLVDEQVHATFVRHLREAARTGIAVGPLEFAIRHRDGRQLVLHSTIFSTPGPTEPRLFCMDVDVTQRREAEEALGAHARHLEVVARVSRELDDARLDVGALARTLVEALGETLGDVCVAMIDGEGESEVDALEAHPDHPDAWVLAAHARAHDGPWGCAVTSDRAVVLGSDEAPPGWGCVVIAPIVARGTVLGTLTVARRPGGFPCSEGERRVVEDLAERAGMGITAARLYRAAETAIRQRDEFLSVASHELRTPLQSLGLVVQGLQAQNARPGGLGALPPTAVSRTLDTLVRQHRRLGRLVDALLDVTRLEAGRLHMEIDHVDLAEVVRDVVDLFRGELVQARCELLLRVDEPIVGRWDRGRLEQVVANLISNAAKYGAGHPVEVTASRQGALARLAVADGGIGMDPATARQIFQRFKRGVSARHYGGLGLGLFIARQIVEALGGSIHVESAPGRGSTFTVELPLAGPREGDGGGTP